MSTDSGQKVFLNGRIVSKSEAAISLDSVAFKYGAKVFEGIRGYWNDDLAKLFVFRLTEHSLRLDQSVKITRMETQLKPEDYRKAVLDVLKANSMKQTVHIRQNGLCGRWGRDV